MECYRCHGGPESYRIIDDRNGESVCNNCGLVISRDQFICQSFDKTKQYSIASSPKNNNDKKTRTTSSFRVNNPAVYKRNYFSDVLNSFSDYTNPLPEDLLSAIYIQASIDPYFKNFKRQPEKKSTQRLLRSIKIPRSLGEMYISRITKKDLTVIDRKNIKMKWVQIRNYLLKKEGIDTKKFVYLEPILIEILKMMFSWVMNEYGKKRHLPTCPRAINYQKMGECKCRRASPNSYTLIYWLLFMLNPMLIVKYQHSIPIPKLKTLRKNLLQVKNVFEITYGKNMEIPLRAIGQNLAELFDHDKFVTENILSKKIEDIDKWIGKIILTRLKEDWLVVLINQLTPLFYPTIWKKYSDLKLLKVKEQHK